MSYFIDMYKSALGLDVKPTINQPSGKRIAYIDIAKGVGIFLVVFIHSDDWYDVEYQGAHAISIFLQPLFFFLSGMFFKTYNGLKDFLKRKINTLLIPFFTFYFLTSCLLPNILHLMGHIVRSEHMIGWQSLWAFVYPAHTSFTNAPLWFLLCLFVVSTMFYGISYLVDAICEKTKLSKSKHSKPILLLVISGILGCWGYYMSVHHIIWYLFTDSACTVMPFFCVGYVLKNYTTVLQQTDKKWWLLIVAICCLAYIYCYAPHLSYRRNILHGSLWMVYSGAFAGICAVMLLCRLCPAIPIVNFWGKYSLIILCTGNVLIQFVALFMRHLPLPGWILFLGTVIIVMMAETLIIPFMVRYFPHITGQKNVLPIDGKK